MKHHALFSFCAVALAILGCKDNVEPERPFYYDFNEKIYITEDRDWLFIKVDSAFKGKVISELGSIPGYAVSAEWSMDDIFSMNAKENASYEDRRSGFDIVKSIPEVLSVNYVYRGDGDAFIGITNEFVVMIGEGVSEEQFQEYVAGYDITERAQSVAIEDRHIFIVPKDGPYTVLEIANRFQESGLVKYSVPNMYMEFVLH